MEFKDILYEKREGVAFIRINRPDVLNAFRPQTIEEMRQAFTNSWNDNDVGVVVLTGT
ncbi:MAG: enoyl-CoA hydratase-related protein, partial [Candidatus Bathyarchaeia archaeon]